MVEGQQEQHVQTCKNIQQVTTNIVSRHLNDKGEMTLKYCIFMCDLSSVKLLFWICACSPSWLVRCSSSPLAVKGSGSNAGAGCQKYVESFFGIILR